MPAAPRPHSRRAEAALARSVETCKALEEHKRVGQRLRKKRDEQWRAAMDEPDSAVTRQRIVDACGVSLQLVDAGLAAARKAKR